MILRNLLVTFRHALRNKVFTLINVTGLSVGFACCMLIYLFASHELSFDEAHSKDIYRVTTIMPQGEGSVHWINTPPALAPHLRSQYSGIENVTQLRFTSEELISRGDRSFYERRAFYADSSFLDVFNFPLLQGDPSTALDEPNSILLTEAAAAKYFGDTNAFGESLILGNRVPLKVTGILAPQKSNEHLNFDVLISFSTYQVPDGYLSDLTSWSWVGFHTYLKLQENTDVRQLESEITGLYTQREIGFSTILQPINEIYFGSNTMTDAENSSIRSGNRTTLYGLLVICFLIISIATFNLMNSTFGLSIKRLKEVGLRKVLGENRGSLVTVILQYSSFLAILGLIFGSGILLIAFPTIRTLLGWDLALNPASFIMAFAAALAVAIVIGVSSGLYPALVLARYHVTTALKGKVKANKNQIGQSAIITIQFAVAVGLILATAVIVRQIDFMRTKSLGFDQEHTLVLKLQPEQMEQYYASYRNALLQSTEVKAVTQASRLMGESLGVNIMTPMGKDYEEGIQIAQILVEYDFLQTMDLELVEGRFLSQDFPSDSTTAVVINESAAKLLGFQDPIGQRVEYLLQPNREIIGIVKDFHFSSMHSEIGPLALTYTFISPRNIIVKVSDVVKGRQVIEDTWAEVVPGIPLDLTFYDDHMNRLYDNEAKLSYLISTFSGIAIFLSIMGLYGVITLLINNKLKELGIRKVLGSSAGALVVLLSKRYFVLAIAALSVGLPVTTLIMGGWLNNFSYQTNMPWWLFAGSGFALLILVASTILQKVHYASKVNPVDVIRNE